MIWDEAVVRFGQAVAHYIRESVLKSNFVGIAWGRTLRATVDGLRTLPNRSHTNSKIEFVPLWGQRLTMQPEVDDTIFTNHTLLSSNSLVADLKEYFCPTEVAASNHLPVFDFVPFDPKYDLFENPSPQQIKEDDEHIEAVFKVFRMIAAYKTVFGEAAGEGLIGRLDAIIGSVGAGATGTRAMGRSDQDYGGIKSDWFSTYILGDVAGVLFMKEISELDPKFIENGKYEKAKKMFERICSHWTGVTRADLVSCSARAQHEGTEGVSLIAFGEERSEICLRAIREGLCTTLYCDQENAAKMLSLVNEALNRARTSKRNR